MPLSYSHPLHQDLMIETFRVFSLTLPYNHAVHLPSLTAEGYSHRYSQL